MLSSRCTRHLLRLSQRSSSSSSSSSEPLLQRPASCLLVRLRLRSRPTPACQWMSSSIASAASSRACSSSTETSTGQRWTGTGSSSASSSSSSRCSRLLSSSRRRHRTPSLLSLPISPACTRPCQSPPRACNRSHRTRLESHPSNSRSSSSRLSILRLAGRLPHLSGRRMRCLPATLPARLRSSHWAAPLTPLLRTACSSSSSSSLAGPCTPRIPSQAVGLLHIPLWRRSPARRSCKRPLRLCLACIRRSRPSARSHPAWTSPLPHCPSQSPLPSQHRSRPTNGGRRGGRSQRTWRRTRRLHLPAAPQQLQPCLPPDPAPLLPLSLPQRRLESRHPPVCSRHPARALLARRCLLRLG